MTLQSKVAGFYPVASCSSPRVVRRTVVRIRCLPSDDIIGRQFLRGEKPCFQTSVRYSTVKMLRQMLSYVKLVWALVQAPQARLCGVDSHHDAGQIDSAPGTDLAHHV